MLAAMTLGNLENGLIVHWSFDGPNISARLLDSSGNGLSPTLAGTNNQNVSWVPGIVGSHAIQFMPAWYKSSFQDRQGATCPYLISPGLRRSGVRGRAAFSAAFWIKPVLPVSCDSSVQNAWVGALSTITNNEYGWDATAWSLQTTQTMQVGTYRTMYAYPTFRALAGEWMLVATTYGGVSGNAWLTVYLNGGFAGVFLARVDPGKDPRLVVGMRVRTELCFKGLVDDVRLYSRELSNDEVYDLWRTACPGSAGTVDDDSDSSTPCSACTAGQYSPLGSSGTCTPCQQGSTDHDGDPATPCVPCGPGHFMASPMDDDSDSATACAEVCSLVGIPEQCNASALGDPSTECVLCGSGVYVPSGSHGPCPDYACARGFADGDSDPSTACVSACTLITVPVVCYDSVYGCDWCGSGCAISGACNFTDKRVPTTDGLVLHWTFAGSTLGERLADQSGHGMDGDLRGRPLVYWTPSPFGTSLMLAPNLTIDIATLTVTQASGCPHVVSPPLRSVNISSRSSVSTLAMWVQPPYTGSDDATTWISLLGNGTSGIALTTEMFFFRGTSRDGRVSLETSFDTGWTHVALTNDGVYVKLYINGFENDRRGAIGFDIGGDAALTLGLDFGGDDLCYMGTFDDVRLYNRALTAAEIATLWRLLCPPAGYYMKPGWIYSTQCGYFACAAGTSDLDFNTSTPCAKCQPGQYMPAGSAGPCAPCPPGTSDIDSDPSTPCGVCGPGNYLPPDNGGHSSYGACSEFNCPAGTVDDDSNTSTPCVKCDPGAYVPAGSYGPCESFRCAGGYVDHDNDTATACIAGCLVYGDPVTCNSSAGVGLVLHWPFEGSDASQRLKDSSGNGKDATITEYPAGTDCDTSPIGCDWCGKYCAVKTQCSCQQVVDEQTCLGSYNCTWCAAQPGCYAGVCPEVSPGAAKAKDTAAIIGGAVGGGGGGLLLLAAVGCVLAALWLRHRRRPKYYDQVDVSEILIGDTIGQGSFGIVYKATWRNTEVAAKVFSVESVTAEEIEQFEKEVDVMRALRHPNILLFMCHAKSADSFIIVTEYMPTGSLMELLANEGVAVPLRLKLSIMSDIARGMAYLHQNDPPILHRDLKSSNILVRIHSPFSAPCLTGKNNPQLDSNLQAKVSDFGLGMFSHKVGDSHKDSAAVIGTIFWTAPEVLGGADCTTKSDVYSFAVIVWEIMTREVPYEELNPHTVHLRVVNEGLRPLLETRKFPGPVQELVAAAARKVMEEVEHVEAPKGSISLVFTDIKGSSSLWEWNASLMRSSLKLHNDILKESLVRHRGYQVKAEGDAFMLAFQSPLNALLFCHEVQQVLLGAPWDPTLLTNEHCAEEVTDCVLSFRGFRVRMGIHFGPVDTRVEGQSTDYSGPTVGIAARIAGLARGGQVLVSSAARAEIERMLRPAEAEKLSSLLTLVALGSFRLHGMPGEDVISEAVLKGFNRRFEMAGSTSATSSGSANASGQSTCPVTETNMQDMLLELIEKDKRKPDWAVDPTEVKISNTQIGRGNYGAVYKGYIHASGIIHRDLKAANILVNSKMDVKITAFKAPLQCVPGAERVRIWQQTGQRRTGTLLPGHAIVKAEWDQRKLEDLWPNDLVPLAVERELTFGKAEKVAKGSNLLRDAVTYRLSDGSHKRTSDGAPVSSGATAGVGQIIVWFCTHKKRDNAAHWALLTNLRLDHFDGAISSL
eukprot:m51a1_g1729 putative serine threonine kinase (1689) ;mRNA; f:135134-146420